jgi:hypothetical protein
MPKNKARNDGLRNTSTKSVIVRLSEKSKRRGAGGRKRTSRNVPTMEMPIATIIVTANAIEKV